MVISSVSFSIRRDRPIQKLPDRIVGLIELRAEVLILSDHFVEGEKLLKYKF